MKILSSAKNPARRVALCSALLGCALILSYVESLAPITPAIPAIKLGLANIAVMTAARVSLKDAAAVSALRVVIVAIFFSNAVSFIFSFCGALFSFAALVIFSVLNVKRVSWIGVSVVCALFHNAGQLFAAFIIIRSSAVVSYIPPLLISSVVCGAINGVVTNKICARITYRGTTYSGISREE